MNDVPVPNDGPPLKAAYQFSVPVLAVAPKVTVPVPQREPGVVLLTEGMALTVTLIELSALTFAQAFFTVSVAVYVPATVPAGTAITIGETGSAASVTLENEPPLHPEML